MLTDDRGQIAGYYFDNLHNQHDFLYSNGKYTTPDDPASMTGTYVTGINNKSQIVGDYQDSGSGSHFHGFLASPEPPFTTRFL